MLQHPKAYQMGLASVLPLRVYCFVVYYGSWTTNGLIRPELPFTSRIVVHLIDILLASVNGTGYQLFTDRFYTSPDSAFELPKMNIHITGTVKTNRKNLPLEFKKPKLKKHEIKAFRKHSKVMGLYSNLWISEWSQWSVRATMPTLKL